MNGPPELEVDVELALEEFRLEVRARCREFPLVVLGPSGSGKTTLLEILAGLRREARGRVRWRGRDWSELGGASLPSRERGVGYVTQASSLFPHLTALGNVEYGRRWGRRRGGGSAEDPLALLAELGVRPLAARRAEVLSGGEIQRVALARALAAHPSLLLLDEPFAHLDPPTRARAHEVLARALATHPVPAVMVSHDRAEAARFARTLWVILGGRVVRQGTWEEIREPAPEPELAAFLGLPGPETI